MADRSVTVSLRANISGLTQGLAAGAAQVRAFSTSLEQNVRKNREGFQGLGLAAGAMGLAAAAGIGVAVSAFADFDQQMSYVQAATHETASGMDRLRDAAMDAGAETAFSATEAAAGIEELAKAGLTTTDIIGGGLAGALDLAAAGGLGVAEAAETTATALSVFNLEGDQATHVADLLAAGAGKAQGTVHDMGAAMNQSALVANQMGLSIEETAGSLALFASNGLLGSDAGTSFRSMLIHLGNPTAEAKTLMEELGLAIYDTSGNFVGMESLAGQLQTRLSGLTQEQRDSALATIFGSDAIRAASILYDEGAEGVQKWTENVDDAGFAAETARIRMDNLRGDLEKLGGSAETALIGLGEQANGPLRDLVQWLTEMINRFAELPTGVQQTVLAVAGLVAVVAGLGGAFLILTPRIAASVAALQTFGVNAAKAKVAALGLSQALGVVAVAWAGVEIMKRGGEFFDWIPEVDKLSTSLRELGETGQVSGELLDVFGADLDKLVGQLSTAPSGVNHWINSLEGNYEALERVDGALADLVNSGNAEEAAAAFDEIAAAAARQGVPLSQVIAHLPAYASAAEAAGVGIGTLRDNLLGAADAQRHAREGIESFGPSYEGAAAAAASASADQVTAAEDAEDALARQEEEIRGVIDAYRAMNDVNFAAIEGAAGYQQAIDDLEQAVSDVVSEHGDLSAALNDTLTGFDDGTQAGRDLQRATLDVAKSASDAAYAARDLAVANGTDLVIANADLVTSLTTSRDNLAQTLVDMGINEEAAYTLADAVINIPDLSHTEVEVDKAQAQADAEAHDRAVRAIPTVWESKLLADPTGAISGAARAQEAINSIYGRTIWVDVDFLVHRLPEGLDRRAEGGYVPPRQGGGHYILGEGGEGEWVVPQSKLTDFIGDMLAQGTWTGGVGPAGPRWDGATLDQMAAGSPGRLQAFRPLPQTQQMPTWMAAGAVGSDGATAVGTAPKHYHLHVPITDSSTPVDVIHREWRTYADVGRD